MTDTRLANPDQAAHWNDRAGHAWADLSDALDRLLAPFVPLLLDAAALQPGGRVLDIGCGAGAVTLAAAARVGSEGRAVGVDISAPLIEAATARARKAGLANAEFVRVDAQAHAFESERFDAILSRFGVMFFENPVAAFRNLATAARPDATLACVAWRSADENPFMTTAERAAAPLLPGFPKREEKGPGQFGWADERQVHAILAESGWGGIRIRPIDMLCSLPEQELGTYVTRMGPLGGLFADLDEAMKAEVARRVEAAFRPFVADGVARFTAACWMVTARA
jgi:SAM-dependent methyltransferase